MRHEMPLRHPWWSEVVPLLVAAGLAIWLLLQPELIRGLPLMLRLPVVLLGSWALGAAFLRPLALDLPRSLLRWAPSPLWGQLALSLFALLMVVRALQA